jgi:hypothetical protein
MAFLKPGKYHQLLSTTARVDFTDTSCYLSSKEAIDTTGVQLRKRLPETTCFGGDKLATLKFTSRERMDVYRRIFLLNRSFHFIVQRLDELSQTHIFSSHALREMRGLAQEVQTEINTLLLNQLESAEMDDWAQFGKVRSALEKRLRGSEPKQKIPKK